jgi:hypothetical protein
MTEGRRRVSEGAAATGRLGALITGAVSALGVDRIRREYWEQNECVFIERFLPAELVEATLVPEVERLRSEVHRNYIPGHKKGGSVSAFTLGQKAPVFLLLYTSPVFMNFLSRLAGAHLMLCPDNDPHACALYYYTEPGDHIGYHYDTSYYRGARYTVLLGLVQRSENCRLVAQLYRDDPARETREISLAYGPGDLVVFNGNKLLHAVTPLAPGEERVVLTMEYVTNQEMALHKRIFSNLKDAFAYFGPTALWPRRQPR